MAENAAQIDAQLDDPAVVSRAQAAGRFRLRRGLCGGFGDGRGLGHGPGKGGLPPHWELVYAKYAGNLCPATRLLRHRVGRDAAREQGRFCQNLAKRKPDTYIIDNASANEHRYYLTWATARCSRPIASCSPGRESTSATA